MILNEVLEDFVKMSKMLEEKDQRIKELEEQLKLAKLEKQWEKDKREEVWKLYEEMKQELELYKKALEIKLKQELRETNELLGVMGATPLTYDDLFEGVLIQAKELLEE